MFEKVPVMPEPDRGEELALHVTVIGTGYVGLVSGACFASLGHIVTCVDRDEAKIAQLRAGQIPIFEPGLEKLIAEGVQAGRLSFGIDLRPAVASADAIFISVGTPPRQSDGHVDLSAVYAVAREIAPALADEFTVIVSKSTVPVGTADEIERIVAEANSEAPFAVVSNPEFLREGAAIADFLNPDRVVIGGAIGGARSIMTRLYERIAERGARVLFTSRRSAEVIKYAANAFLAVKITFINEIADLCEGANADVREVAVGIGLDSRIGGKFLNAGPGFGGSCFPKDTSALVRTAQDFNRPLRLIETTIGINEQRKRGMARKVTVACGGSVRGKTIAILGLAFKANTDDVRGAPSLDIIRALQDLGADVNVYDPVAMVNAKPLLDDVAFKASIAEAVGGASAVVIVTDWPEFAEFDLTQLRKLLKEPVLVDLRNQLDGKLARRKGFTYVGVGQADHGFDPAISTALPDRESRRRSRPVVVESIA